MFDLVICQRLYRTDDKRPDGVTMNLWEMGEQLGWLVTVLDALALPESPVA